MSKNKQQPSGSPLASPSCSSCRFWEPSVKDENGQRGKCRDAMIRARFAINFGSIPETYAWGGQNCLCFETSAKADRSEP